MPIQLSDSPAPSSIYVTKAYMEYVRGEENIRKWSIKENSESENADIAAINSAIASSSNQIDGFLRRRYYVPLRTAEGDDSVTIFDSQILQRWAEVLASYELRRYRGDYDADSEGDSMLQARTDVFDELDKFTEPGNLFKLDTEQLPEGSVNHRVGEVVGRPCPVYVERE